MVTYFARIWIKFMYEIAACCVLVFRPTGVGIFTILSDFSRLYNELSANVPGARTFVGKVAVYTGCAIISLERAMQKNGLEQAKAEQLIFAINKIFVYPLGTPVYLIFRLFIRNRITRGRAIIDFFYRFVFTNPPWEREITEDSGENYRFLLKTCPFSDVFRLHESPHLCSKVLCYFDVYMADKWKVAFTRPITLVEGGPYCDFIYNLAKTSFGNPPQKQADP